MGILDLYLEPVVIKKQAAKLHPLAEISIWLDDFWNKFGGHKNLGYGFRRGEKRKELRKMSELTFSFKRRSALLVRRESFNKIKFDRHSLKSHKNCFICLQPANIRHHIIGLKNGGTNARRNLVSLCNHCHADIHPWLKVKK